MKTLHAIQPSISERMMLAMMGLLFYGYDFVFQIDGDILNYRDRQTELGTGRWHPIRPEYQSEWVARAQSAERNGTIVSNMGAAEMRQRMYERIMP